MTVAYSDVLMSINGYLTARLFLMKSHGVILCVQAPQKHQKYVAHVLGLPMSKVVCKTKRIGGGFGGKETRSAFLAAAASVPSYLLNLPVKLTLDRDTDMMITGQRHSFLGKYKVSFFFFLLKLDYTMHPYVS